MFGAAQIATPANYPQFIVPALGVIGGVSEDVELTVDASGNTKPVIVAPNGFATIIVSFAAAGASALPANLIVAPVRQSQS